MFRDTMNLPPLGEDRLVLVEEYEKILRYGSSMALMVRASNTWDAEFNPDPTKDWTEQTNRKRELLYLTLEDPNANNCVVTALRAILDIGSDVRRLLIDLMCTKKAYRSMGYGAYVVNFVLRLAAENGLDVYVMSIEEAVSYWMKFGFILEQDPVLNTEYNAYTDTYLLKLPTNR